MPSLPVKVLWSKTLCKNLKIIGQSETKVRALTTNLPFVN